MNAKIVAGLLMCAVLLTTVSAATARDYKHQKSSRSDVRSEVIEKLMEELPEGTNSLLRR